MITKIVILLLMPAGIRLITSQHLNYKRYICKAKKDPNWPTAGSQGEGRKKMSRKLISTSLNWGSVSWVKSRHIRSDSSVSKGSQGLVQTIARTKACGWLPAVMLPGGEPEPTLTPVALSCQVVRVPAGHLQQAAKWQFSARISTATILHHSAFTPYTRPLVDHPIQPGSLPPCRSCPPAPS